MSIWNNQSSDLPIEYVAENVLIIPASDPVGVVGDVSDFDESKKYDGAVYEMAFIQMNKVHNKNSDTCKNHLKECLCFKTVSQKWKVKDQ